MYVHTGTFIVKGCKNVQNWNKGCVFGNDHKFWKKDGRKLREKHIKMPGLEKMFNFSGT